MKRHAVLFEDLPSIIINGKLCKCFFHKYLNGRRKFIAKLYIHINIINYCEALDLYLLWILKVSVVLI